MIPKSPKLTKSALIALAPLSLWEKLLMLPCASTSFIPTNMSDIAFSLNPVPCIPIQLTPSFKGEETYMAAHNNQSNHTGVVHDDVCWKADGMFKKELVDLLHSRSRLHSYRPF